MKLIPWDKLRHQIESSKDIQELSNLRDQVEAFRILAKQSKQSLETQNKIVEYRLRIDRKIGDFSKSLPKQKNQYCTEPQVQSKSEIIKEAGLNNYRKLETIANLPEKVFEEHIQQIKEKEEELTTSGVLKLVKDIQKKDRVEKEKKDRKEAITTLDIRIGDFKSVLSDIYDIDAIITDPPYPHEYIECFSDLGKYAKDHVKKDGFIAVYSGQYHLPEVINRLSEHLTYVWTFCLYHVGKKQLVNGVNIMCGWKPVLIFSNGKKKMRFSAYDVLTSEQREKSGHEWQQSESGVESLIEILTKPNDLIVDPFSGAGTFGKVSTDLGRNFIGAEING